MKKLYRNFIFDIIIAVLMLALGIVMLPPLGIGQKALYLLAAVVLVAYVIIYMVDKIRRSKGTILVLAFVEAAILAFIALALVIEQFSSLRIGGVCMTMGAVLWMRGIFSSVGLYLTATQGRRTKYGMVKFLLCVLLSTVGVYLFAAPIISDIALNWIACVLFFLVALSFGALAILFAPTRKSK